jgi:hypothetical protein
MTGSVEKGGNRSVGCRRVSVDDTRHAALFPLVLLLRLPPSALGDWLPRFSGFLVAPAGRPHQAMEMWTLWGMNRCVLCAWWLHCSWHPNSAKVCRSSLRHRPSRLAGAQAGLQATRPQGSPTDNDPVTWPPGAQHAYRWLPWAPWLHKSSPSQARRCAISTQRLAHSGERAVALPPDQPQRFFIFRTETKGGTKTGPNARLLSPKTSHGLHSNQIIKLGAACRGYWWVQLLVLFFSFCFRLFFVLVVFLVLFPSLLLVHPVPVSALGLLCFLHFLFDKFFSFLTFFCVNFLSFLYTFFLFLSVGCCGCVCAARLKKTLSETKMGVPLPTSFNLIMYALKLIGKAIGTADARSYLSTIINDMEVNGVSEKEAMQREIILSRVSANEF